MNGSRWRPSPAPRHRRAARCHAAAYVNEGKLRRHSRMPITIKARYMAKSSIVTYRCRVKYRHRLTESIISHQCQFSYTLRATRKVANVLDHVTIESTKGDAAGVKCRKKKELISDSTTTPNSAPA